MLCFDIICKERELDAYRIAVFISADCLNVLRRNLRLERIALRRRSSELIYSIICIYKCRNSIAGSMETAAKVALYRGACFTASRLTTSTSSRVE